MDSETELLAAQSSELPGDYDTANLEKIHTPHHQAPVVEPEMAEPEPETNSYRSFLLVKFTLYETKHRIYIVGSNARETRFRMLEIDITLPKDELKIYENRLPCSRKEIMEVLSTLEQENKASGGLTKKLTACGILGFIRFTEGYYMSVITKRSVVALLGGHYVYHVDKTELVPLAHSTVYRKPDRRSEEARFIQTFSNLDLSKTFYFSYTYDITHTLQYNLSREKSKAMGIWDQLDEHHEMFVWNNALLSPIVSCFDDAMDWCVPVIHGFIDQAKISVCGRSVLVAIIARRSHYFAGARFLKRGVNDQGNVANEVETEQVVTDLLTSSFHDPRDGLFNNPRYSSYVQHRGSIPLYWSQDVSNMSPKPPIELNCVDPFYAAAALHFNDMFARYGRPIIVLNLIKGRERMPRESKLLKEFQQCVQYLNQFLDDDCKIDYKSWDMSRASKSRNQEVIEFLENYADETLQKTGFFHNGKNLGGMKIQDGVCRTNCIDCLDRTNAAQFVIGKKALGYQLHALGIIEDPQAVEYDSDAVNLLTEMFHDHGDTIALQYGGSHLVNTMETYRKINQWTSHSRDMIESIRRFYNNSFVDSQRQDAINLFLGNYVWEQGEPMLWDLPTDYYLHNNFKKNEPRRSYRKWWVPNDLQTLHERLQHQIDEAGASDEAPLAPYRGFFDNYWNEYYKPRSLSSFALAFTYSMNSTLRYSPVEDPVIGPFKSRKPDRRRKSKHYEPPRGEDRVFDSVRRQAMTRASMVYPPVAAAAVEALEAFEEEEEEEDEDKSDDNEQDDKSSVDEEKQLVRLLQMHEPDYAMYCKSVAVDDQGLADSNEYEPVEHPSDVDFYRQWTSL